MELIRVENPGEMGRKAAGMLGAQIILKPSSVLGLATGSTPLQTYAELIVGCQSGDLDFSRVRSVNLDEYCGLSPEHPQSYRHYMEENFFRHINIRPENTHIPNGLSEDFEEEGRRYDRLIRDLGGIDLQLLGIGNTGHIGFNEPGPEFVGPTHRVKLNRRTIEANSRFFPSAEDVPKFAVTMGMSAIMHARKIVLAASGAGKAQILYDACFGPITPLVPASILQLHPDVTVIAEAEAMSVILQRRPEAVR